MRDGRGSILPLVGGLLFVSLVVLALATDLALLHGTYRESAAAADFAAEAGASMVDAGSLHAGRLELDPAAAEIAARATVDGSFDGSVKTMVEVSPNEICVSVVSDHQTIALPAVGIRSVVVRVRSCAEPATG
jgi:hypothetical protein